MYRCTYRIPFFGVRIVSQKKGYVSLRRETCFNTRKDKKYKMQGIPAFCEGINACVLSHEKGY